MAQRALYILGMCFFALQRPIKCRAPWVPLRFRPVSAFRGDKGEGTICYTEVDPAHGLIFEQKELADGLNCETMKSFRCILL